MWLFIPSLLMSIGLYLFVFNENPRSILPRRSVVSFLFIVNVIYIIWRLYSTVQYESSIGSLWMILFLISETILNISTLFMIVAFWRYRNRSNEASFHHKIIDYPVDIIIPTYKEGREILERTIKSAIKIDWKNVNIYICDDTSREWVRDLCAQYGVHHITRTQHQHAKAGNVNNCLLHHSQSDFIAVFDADFYIYPEFIKRTLPLLLHKNSNGLVQTPQHYGNPDPIQRNLFGENSWVDEQRFFFDVHAGVRDAWDQMFCCGTGWIARRSALNDIGLIPTESVTEDILTSYTMKQYGWNTIYLNECLANGLSAESINEYIGQRSRWALGCLQCLYSDRGPIKSKRMNIIDRLWFLDACIYWMTFLHIPLMFLAPIVYYYFGLPVIQCDPYEIAIFLLPKIALTTIGIWWLSERKVIPFISDIQKLVTSVMMIPHVLSGLFNIKGQIFRVTAKGLSRKTWSIQWFSMIPFITTITLTCLSILTNFEYGSDVIYSDNGIVSLLLSFWNIIVCLFCCFACIDKPVDKNPILEAEIQPLHGSIKESLKILFKNIAN